MKASSPLKKGRVAPLQNTMIDYPAAELKQREECVVQVCLCPMGSDLPSFPNIERLLPLTLRSLNQRQCQLHDLFTETVPKSFSHTLGPVQLQFIRYLLLAQGLVLLQFTRQPSLAQGCMPLHSTRHRSLPKSTTPLRLTRQQPSPAQGPVPLQFIRQLYLVQSLHLTRQPPLAKGHVPLQLTRQPSITLGLVPLHLLQ